VSKSDEIDAKEAYAFLEVVAPRLEQLRRRLTAAKALLRTDPENGRLEAIIGSQTAVKEFLSAIPDFAALVEPIDVLLEAVREEAAETESEEVEAAEPSPPEVKAEPTPTPPPPSADPADTGAKPSAVAAERGLPPDDGWLHIGTAIAIEKLTAAGMAAGSAEFYLEQVYATVGLRSPEGAPISVALIKEWRAKVIGPGAGTWRRGGLMKRRASGGKGPASLADVKARVDEIAVMFKKMAPWASRDVKGRTR
jgi:hypothetical protein